jgi:hypothetical protein
MQLEQPGYWKKKLTTFVACFLPGNQAALAGYVVHKFLPSVL